MSAVVPEAQAKPADPQLTPADGLRGREEILDLLSKVKLLEEDGIPLETGWHRWCMNLLIEVIEWLYRDRKDFYVGGNQFIYFNLRQARNLDYRGPDFFFVDDVPHEPLRRYWAVWEENGRYPDVIIELSSPTTAREDHTTKKQIYEKTFRTYEYFIYDPFTQTLHGWRLVDKTYVPIPPDETGRLECRQLGLWLGTWKGKYLGREDVWLRFYDREGKVMPIGAEAEAAAKEAALRRAEATTAAREAERQRADALAAEVAQLRAQLAAREQPSSTDPNPAH